jgi:hypothetical protein
MAKNSLPFFFGPDPRRRAATVRQSSCSGRQMGLDFILGRHLKIASGEIFPHLLQQFVLHFQLDPEQLR